MGGGGGCFEKYSWGPGTGGVGLGAPGGRAGSKHDKLLSLTMTHDWCKFRNDPSWRSKVIIRKP